MSFLEKVEPYILSDYKFLRKFALESIHSSYLGTEQTYFYALEALDKLPVHKVKNSIMPYVRNIPITENILKELLHRLEKNDGNGVWYTLALAKLDTDLIVKYQDSLKSHMSADFLKSVTAIKTLSVEELFMEAGEVMSMLEEKYNQGLFEYGKRIFNELIDRKEYSDKNIWEIEVAIKDKLENDFLPMNVLFNIYLAGALKIHSLVPLLTKLLSREDDGFLQESLETTLIKIGTDEVVEKVEPYVLKGDAAFTAIGILENIKSPRAEEILLRQFHKTDDITIKTLLADALCKQLSTKAIPLVETLIDKGYDETMLSLEESLYANCVMNQIDHPKLNDWKQHITKIDDDIALREKELTRQMAKKNNVGRNDPCPCGSGKKFKKCCG
ncbi:hypothetical protein JOD43_003480 [Pullulanibacillus pueri]|uniref:Zinc chelation protein SecC n=1 Tax=Pullulanibacillus pueri TaxID=1437324 RepID=A0A8J3ENG7_9BACL|nr:SEC-C metal-binding domain-containing protein [Pullulanibacillus pueri]MBM7683300.1 hypothetical protein [Pullulanibacillus pueri]GGH86462.1 hypothetical protein GCM10007096_34230 [Pullulanibacillus pueri]